MLQTARQSMPHVEVDSNRARQFTNVRPFEEIPGDPGWPILGNTIPMMMTPVTFLEKWYEKYGPISRTRSVGVDILLLLGPELNRLILLDPHEAISSRQGLSFYMDPFFKDGLVLLDFDEHKLHRGIMMSAFRKERLAAYLGLMNPVIDAHTDRWMQTRGGRPMDRRTFYFFPNFKHMALQIATRVFMGHALDADGDKLIQAFQDVVAASVALVRKPIPGTAYYRGVKAREMLEDYFYSHIPEKRRNPGDDLFSQLCIAEDDDGNTFTDEQIVNHMIFLMMAAHDTTTMTTTRVVYHLAKHLDWQEKVRQECRALGTEYLTPAHVMDLPNLELVIKEALRLCAPVPGLPRRTIKDLNIGGYFVPAGTQVQVDMRHTHYMDEFWDDPHEFRPERYAEGGIENKAHRYAWLPFGGGAHKCIGRHFGLYQIRAVVHQLTQKYRWHVRPGYKMPLKNPGLPMPADGFPVTFERI